MLGLVVGANGRNGVGAALVEDVRVFAVAVAISCKGVEGARGIDEAGGVDTESPLPMLLLAVMCCC